MVVVVVVVVDVVVVFVITPSAHDYESVMCPSPKNIVISRS